MIEMDKNLSKLIEELSLLEQDNWEVERCPGACHSTVYKTFIKGFEITLQNGNPWDAWTPFWVELIVERGGVEIHRVVEDQGDIKSNDYPISGLYNNVNSRLNAYLEKESRQKEALERKKYDESKIKGLELFTQAFS